MAEEQWLSLPDVLQQSDRVYWDNLAGNQSLVFTKVIEDRIRMIPIRIGGITHHIDIEVLAFDI